MRGKVLWLILILSVVTCKESTKPTSSDKLSADDIIDKSIFKSGGSAFNRSRIAFQFRDHFYTALRKKGDFSLSRIRTEQDDSIIDILSNEGFARFINNEFQTIPDSLGLKYAASVNSVHYFSVLPYGLNDGAVNKVLLGQEVINNRNHYKIQITFNPNGGGEDYEDVFIYWVDKESFKVNYLAYSYEEGDGVGLRFREAYNETYIEGLRFVDYKNFKPRTDEVQLHMLGELYNSGKLELVSKIELQNITVKLFDL